ARSAAFNSKSSRCACLNPVTTCAFSAPPVFAGSRHRAFLGMRSPLEDTHSRGEAARACARLQSADQRAWAVWWSLLWGGLDVPSVHPDPQHHTGVPTWRCAVRSECRTTLPSAVPRVHHAACARALIT